MTVAVKIGCPDQSITTWNRRPGLGAQRRSESGKGRATDTDAGECRGPLMNAVDSRRSDSIDTHEEEQCTDTGLEFDR